MKVLTRCENGHEESSVDGTPQTCVTCLAEVARVERECRQRAETFALAVSVLVSPLSARLGSPDFPGKDAEESEVVAWVRDVAHRLGERLKRADQADRWTSRCSTSVAWMVIDANGDAPGRPHFKLEYAENDLKCLNEGGTRGPYAIVSLVPAEARA